MGTLTMALANEYIHFVFRNNDDDGFVFASLSTLIK